MEKKNIFILIIIYFIFFNLFFWIFFTPEDEYIKQTDNFGNYDLSKYNLIINEKGNKFQASHISLSPNGNDLFFLWNNISNNNGLTIWNLNMTNKIVTKIYNDKSNIPDVQFNIHVNRNGNKILFLSKNINNKTRSLNILIKNGSTWKNNPFKYKPIEKIEDDIKDFSISPNLKIIAFLTYNDTGENILWTMNIEGSNKTKLLSADEIKDPNFTSNGKELICYIYDKEENNFGLFLIDINNGWKNNIISFDLNYNEPYLLSNDKIIVGTNKYSHQIFGYRPNNIWSMDLNGENRKLIIVNASNISFNSDLTKMVFFSNENNNNFIYIIESRFSLDEDSDRDHIANTIDSAPDDKFRGYPGEYKIVNENKLLQKLESAGIINIINLIIIICLVVALKFIYDIKELKQKSEEEAD